MYLRIAVTSACNLRCEYCAPAPKPEPASALLSARELADIVSVIHQSAPLSKVRLTGGEPLLRPDLIEIVSHLRQALPGAELCLTTNGTLLTLALANQLRAAGITRLNISLDTLDSAAFTQITGGGLLKETLRGISAAREAGIERVKLNAVLLRTGDIAGITELVDFAVQSSLELRFIELMPFPKAREMHQRAYLPAQEVVRLLTARYGDFREVRREGSATVYEFHAGTRLGRVGFITSVSRPFCATCDRLRLDSHGIIHSCLRGPQGFDIRTPYREGDLPRVVAHVRAALALKKTVPTPTPDQWPERSISDIGG